MRKKWIWWVLETSFAFFIGFIALAPPCYIFALSFFDCSKSGISAMGYYDVFLASPSYLLRFWKSLLICLGIVSGQLFVSVTGGFGFAKCKFRGRNFIFFLLLIIMVLPLQVTLVPNYIVLDYLHLTDTEWSLILPSVFAPLGVFIMTQGFKSVPDGQMEAAALDGANLFHIIWKIMLPMNKSALVGTAILSFLDGWNMVEQPITYLKDFEKYPLSVALSYAPSSGSAVQLACCVLAALPPVGLFLCFSQELVEGIVLAEVK